MHVTKQAQRNILGLYNWDVKIGISTFQKIRDNSEKRLSNYLKYHILWEYMATCFSVWFEKETTITL